MLSATLTVVSFPDGDGCGIGNSASAQSCQNPTVLTRRSFTIGEVSYQINRLILASGTLVLELSGGLPDAVERAHALELTEGGATSRLTFSEADNSQFSNTYVWSSVTGQSWSAGDTVSVKVVTLPPDTTPPSLVLGASSHVAASGEAVVLRFSEALDHEAGPGAERFAVEADGEAVAVEAFPGCFGVPGGLTEST